MRELLTGLVYYSDIVFLIYFFIVNLSYTALMALSLYSVSLHAKYAARKPYRHLADSPMTPPVAIVVAAYNEEVNIVQTVLSLMHLNYPEKELIVVDDGSTDSTLDVLIQRFQLGPWT